MANIKLYVVQVYIFTILFIKCQAASSESSLKIPAILVFGDSTVDTGNNNYIPTALKANFFPYGQNYPGQEATGRFSDGKLIPDLLASTLKIKEAVPPFLDPNLPDSELLTGVNFASAGAGFDLQTNALLNIIAVPKQIGMFKHYIARLKGLVGEEKANQTISGALVVISAGSNDVLTRPFNLQYSFQDSLLNTLKNFITDLYGLGCRSISVAGLSPLGYVPIEKTIHSATKFLLPLDQRWVYDLNSYAQSYNQKLVKLLAQLEATLPASKIAYNDVYGAVDDMVKDPEKYGFLETRKGCCGTGLIEVGPLCSPTTLTCGKSLAPRFIFWDAVHPSSTTYRIMAEHFEKEILPKFL